MGLLDIFRVGKVVTHVAKTVKNQRIAAQDLRALPMPQFIEQCLAGMHSEHAPWRGQARVARADAQTLAADKRLPTDLADFYTHCDGFASSEDFPAPVLALAELKLGADHAPAPSQVIQAFWKEHGNDSGREGQLMVLPPDNLLALMNNDAQTFVRPAAMDMMVPIVPVREDGFAVVLLAGAGEHLPAGSVLQYENGIVTRYDDFRHWLANWASLLGSIR
ncbi:hypothetical protein FN976_19615 [Caenimonas sedimenti]|uniref:SMI1/KNR4 family protein n=1 Tax=Caenimonas sedimenti TaxID=2596921 RepID=A0A562ZME9_9BURK|nr:hypothetical protein [Caenimonas sedimenti]TWO69495.1 hypothetical protein FN976_19615 [Caenimonas sedimenti]